MCTHTTAHMWKPEDNLQGSVPPVHLEASGTQTQVLELGGKHLNGSKAKLFKVYMRRAG